MGTWGYSVGEDDAALDAYDEYFDLFNDRRSASEIEAALRKSFAEPLEDEDDAVSVELGIAKAQWECGHVTADTIARIEAIIASDAGMALWEEAGPRAAAKRRKVLAAFLEKLRTPNPKPKQPRNAKLRTPVFRPGECLAMWNPKEKRFGAGIVLLSPIESPGPGQDTHGVNSIGFLDYFKESPPTMEVFEKRQWLYEKVSFPACPNDWVIAVAHLSRTIWNIEHSKKLVAANGEPDVRVIGTTTLTEADGLESTIGTGWTLGGAFAFYVDTYAAAKGDRTMKRWRSYHDLLDGYPRLRDEFRALGAFGKREAFDTGPLHAR